MLLDRWYWNEFTVEKKRSKRLKWRIAEQSKAIIFFLSVENPLWQFTFCTISCNWWTEHWKLRKYHFYTPLFSVFDCAEAQWIRWKSLAAISICIQTSQIYSKYLQRWCLLSGFRFAIVLFPITKTLFQHFQCEIHVLKVKTDSGSEMMVWKIRRR